MDSNTKIIILVLILVLIKIFAPTIDYFEHTSPESEQCTTILVNPKPAKCPSRQKLIGGMCWEEKKVCVPQIIDNFATISPQQFKLYNPDSKVYVRIYNNKSFDFTHDEIKASLFYVDSENNLKYDKYFCNGIYYNEDKTFTYWDIVLNPKKDSKILKFDGKYIYNEEIGEFEGKKYYRKNYLTFNNNFGKIDKQKKGANKDLQFPDYSFYFNIAVPIKTIFEKK